jgi:hypothetical protein
MLYNIQMGRKPEGLGKSGEPKRIRDYPKLLVTIRPEVHNALKRAATREKRPMWKIIDDVFRLYQNTNARKRRSK